MKLIVNGVLGASTTAQYHVAEEQELNPEQKRCLQSTVEIHVWEILLSRKNVTFKTAQEIKTDL